MLLTFLMISKLAVPVYRILLNLLIVCIKGNNLSFLKISQYKKGVGLIDGHSSQFKQVGPVPIRANDICYHFRAIYMETYRGISSIVLIQMYICFKYQPKFFPSFNFPKKKYDITGRQTKMLKYISPLQRNSETLTLRTFTPSFKNYINESSEPNPAPKNQWFKQGHQSPVGYLLLPEFFPDPRLILAQSKVALDNINHNKNNSKSKSERWKREPK